MTGSTADDYDRRPPGVDDATVEAVGGVSEALEWVEGAVSSAPAADAGLHRTSVCDHRVVLLGLAMVGVAIVVFDAVSGATAGWIAGACAAVAMTVLWILLPVFQRVTDDATPGQH